MDTENGVAKCVSVPKESYLLVRSPRLYDRGSFRLCL